jgi:hypothetical protein
LTISHHDAAKKKADERHFAECGTCRSILTIGGEGVTHYNVSVDTHDILCAANESIMDMQFAHEHIKHPRSPSTDKGAVLDMLEHGIKRMQRIADGHALYPTDPDTEGRWVKHSAHIINDAQKDALFALLAPNLLLDRESETYKATNNILFALDPNLTNGLTAIKRILEEEERW